MNYFIVSGAPSTGQRFPLSPFFLNDIALEKQ